MFNAIVVADYGARADDRLGAYLSISDERTMGYFHVTCKSASCRFDMSTEDYIVSDSAIVPDEAKGAEQVVRPRIHVG
jgi:hypothetical protein